MTNETIYETYVRQICSNCKNREQCQEELRIKVDGTIKCNSYETTFVPNKNIDRLRYSTIW